MNGHDEETYERKDLPTAFVPRETAEAFKKYVHDRLDKMGVPSDPEPEQNAKHGCRIEGRLNYIEQETAQLREALKELIPIAEGHIKIAHSLSIYPTEFEEIKKYKETIENARKLTNQP